MKKEIVLFFCQNIRYFRPCGVAWGCNIGVFNDSQFIKILLLAGICMNTSHFIEISSKYLLLYVFNARMSR